MISRSSINKGKEQNMTTCDRFLLATKCLVLETQYCPDVKHGGGSITSWEDPYSLRKKSLSTNTVTGITLISNAQLH